MAVANDLYGSTVNNANFDIAELRFLTLGHTLVTDRPKRQKMKLKFIGIVKK